MAHLETPSDSLGKLSHPVIDTDAHLIECLPVLFDYLRQVGGTDMAQRAWTSFKAQHSRSWYDQTTAERLYHNTMRPSFWAAPAANTFDRATAMLPQLLHERLPEIGIDFAVVYPTIGFLLPDISDADVRRAACRAENMMVAELFAGLNTRLTPAAVIPCHTPDEAIEELEYCVRELGFKVAMFQTLVRRPIAAVQAQAPDVADYAFWLDPLALDSPYDYDPLWAKCIELNIPVTSHAVGQGVQTRRSTSNWMFSHTGHFAEAAQAVAKAMFFGGVTRRFPDLPFAFLECGVSWAANMVNGIAERWSKRNRQAIQQYNPAHIQYPLLKQLFEDYGGAVLAERTLQDLQARNPRLTELDDFAEAGLRNRDDLLARLVPNYYYGCAAGDPMTACAFDTDRLPGEKALKAMFSSDLGHWDVTDMKTVVQDSLRLVEQDILSPENFQDLAFSNPVNFYTHLNEDFFVGTEIESSVIRCEKRWARTHLAG